jgi:hypothetical protein
MRICCSCFDRLSCRFLTFWVSVLMSNLAWADQEVVFVKNVNAIQFMFQPEGPNTGIAAGTYRVNWQIDVYPS